ncbi:MAG TPA: hypothetical protein VGK19_12650 [Capsulimonadaceae bacterium]|jgi:hypothetical protein
MDTKNPAKIKSIVIRTVIAVFVVGIIGVAMYHPDQGWQDHYYYDLCRGSCAALKPEADLLKRLGKPSETVMGPHLFDPPPAGFYYATGTPRGKNLVTPFQSYIRPGEKTYIYRSPSGRSSLYIYISKDGIVGNEIRVVQDST